MKLQLFDREVGRAKTAVTTQRSLGIGTVTPQATSKLATALEQQSLKVAARVKAANDVTEYSKVLSNVKLKMGAYYAKRTQNKADHKTLVKDTAEHFKKVRFESLKGISDLTQEARVAQGLDQIGVAMQSTAISDASRQSIDHSKATHINTRAVMLLDASSSNDMQMRSVFQNYSNMTRSLSEIGVYDSAYAENDVLSFYNEAVHGKVRRLINDDPWQAKDYLESDESFSKLLGEVKRGSLISQAQTQINMRENHNKTQGDAWLKAIEKANKDETAATVKQLHKGRVPKNYDELLETVKGTDLEPKLIEAHAIASDISVFNTMSPDQKQIFINSAKKDGRVTGKESEKIDLLEKNLDFTLKQLSDGNGLEIAFEQGVIEQLTPLAYEWPDVLEQRKDLTSIASQHYGRTISPITKGEASQLVGELDAMIVTERAKRLGTMVGAWDELALPAFEQIAKKNGGTYAIAGDLVRKGRPDTAIEMMNGLETMKANPKIIPTDFIDSYTSVVGDAYNESPEQSKYVREATKALYAQLMIRSGNSIPDMADTDDIETALDAITGGIYELDIESFGFNDSYKVEAPRHDVTQDDFEGWMEGLQPVDIEQMGGTSDNKAIAKRINEGKVKLITLGEGHYGVKMPDGRPIVDNNGRGFVLRYPE